MFIFQAAPTNIEKDKRNLPNIPAGTIMFCSSQMPPTILLRIATVTIVFLECN